VHASFEDLLQEVHDEFPSFKIVRKADSVFMRLIGFLLLVGTFGRMKTFMQSFTTTIGSTIYTPASWEDSREESKCVILRHERVHLRQQAFYGRLTFSLLYLFVFFPVGLAYYRAKFEKQAYAESLRARLDYYGPEAITDRYSRESMVSNFTGAGYMWMWPFRSSIEKWYDLTVSSLLR
jgi:hypothetical protein